ncbi:MAG: phosphoribosyl-AMP cyclohydrolase [Spirochaetia bacterium]
MKQDISIDFKKQSGIVPVVVQDAETKDVLMLAYMDKQAWEKTLETGIAHYYSRSRKKLWKKGESSGNTQTVREIRIDCDNDTILLFVNQAGGIACHTGRKSCFYRKVDKNGMHEILPILKDPSQIYK